MAAKNPDSLDNQGQFHARIIPAQQIGQKWVRTRSFHPISLQPRLKHLPQHKPGNEQGNDAAPEYHAQSFPSGTAPPENTFRPNPVNAGIGQANDANATHEEGHTDALDMPGSTSRDIHNTINFEHGRPMINQTNREIRGAHPGKRKKDRSGLEGVGASTNESVFDQVRHQVADKDGVEKGQRGHTGEREGGMATGGAESVPPVTAEERATRQGPQGRTVT